MRVRVKLFARLRDLTGTSDLVVEVPAGATIGDVWATLTGRFPAVAPYAGSMSVASNLEYAKLTTVVQDDDEIAFMPPVSGG